MYKLHYDVNAGEQLSIGYKGVEFEVQAGTGGGSDVEVETNKEVEITENGTVEITPSSGKDAMAKVTATVNVPTSDVEVEDNKTVTITTNGTHEITPSIDKDAMEKVTATVNVPIPSVQIRTQTTITSNGIHYIYPDTGYDGTAYVKALVQVPTSSVDVEENKTFTITQNGTYEIIPSVDKDAMEKVTATVDVPTSVGDIETNKTRTITQNGTFEITPSSGKDVMAKVTAVVNVPRQSTDVWTVNKPQKIIDASIGGRYTYHGTTPYTTTLTYSSYVSATADNLDVRGDYLTCIFPVLPIRYTGMLFYFWCNVVFGEGDQQEYTIGSVTVRGNARFPSNITIGTPSSYGVPSYYYFYGPVTIEAVVRLGHCNVYFQTNDITITEGGSILDGWPHGEVHVLTTFVGDTLGGHRVIKDLTA